tara:strand:- start:650 stop:754 length:105 start_codon:yes stop_codon:yes gene_type:complete
MARAQIDIKMALKTFRKKRMVSKRHFGEQGLRAR